MHDVVFNRSISSVGTSPLRVRVSDGKDVENMKACTAHARGSKSVVQQNALLIKKTIIRKTGINEII